MPRLTDVEVGRALAMFAEDYSFRAIAAELGVGVATISRLINRVRETGNAAYRHGGGRPRVTCPADDMSLKLAAIREPFLCAREIGISAGVCASRQTVYRRLRALGVRSYRAVIKPELLRRHREKRLAFANLYGGWGDNEWARVIFSDECKIMLRHTVRQRVYRTRCSRLDPRFVLRDNFNCRASITVWGGISIDGRTNLVLLRDGALNGQNYIELVLRPVVIPYVGQFGRDFLYVDDNAPAHRGRAVVEFCRENNINRCDWPACSPDLNPIENVWAMLKRRIRARRPVPMNLDELAVAINEEWQAIPQEHIASTIKSMQRRCREVIRTRGFSLKY